ncbi:MAG: hypothetical protein KDA96_03800 [Planctomycetaceae bacterium]|nr:hypothetical protein [Planctomycetaceae bacterium]
MLVTTWFESLANTAAVRNRRPLRRKAARSSTIAAEQLEARQLLSATNGEFQTLLDGDGNEYCELTTSDDSSVGEANTVAGRTTTSGSNPFDYAQTFFLHSNPGANHTIYLDFDGHTTSGTAWNQNFTGNANIVTPAYNPDGVSGFSNTELTSIQKIWQRVAEDFIAFDVNVTTQAPATSDLIKSGSGDLKWGIRVVIGGDCMDWYGSSAGGVAYLTSFSWNTDTPTYVFPNQLGNGYEKYVAEAVSHEVGHTLGLSHDGTATVGYYSGHGSGETGWAPIMGVGYSQNLSQWSKGEYSGANQTQDDLNIITTANGFGYRSDDYGNTTGTAQQAHIVTPSQIDGSGIIERETDIDVFSFTTGAGSISFSVSAFELGPNLDILAGLYDATGTLVTSSNPTAALGASITANVNAGTYYLKIQGTGNGNPLTTGYTGYGSLGQYSFSGSIIGIASTPTLSISDASATEGGLLQFTVSLTQPSDNTVSVTYATQSGSATTSSDFTRKSGTISFAPGETSKTITINSLQDTAFEGDETFTISLSNVSGAIIGDGTGVGTIADDDVSPRVSISDSSVTEGNLKTSGKQKGKPTQKSMTFTVTLSGASSQTVSLKYGTRNGTARTSDKDYVATSGTLTFAPGETTKTITVITLGDKKKEANETFTVSLSRPSGATIADGTGVGTIRNDDGKTTGSSRAVRRGAEWDGEPEEETSFEIEATPFAQTSGSTFRWSARRDDDALVWTSSEQDTVVSDHGDSAWQAAADTDSSIAGNSADSSESDRSDGGLDDAFADGDALMTALNERLPS